MTSSLILIFTLYFTSNLHVGCKSTNTNIAEISCCQNYLSYNVFIVLFQYKHTCTHAKSANIHCDRLRVFLKVHVYYALLFVALTTKGHWELTDVRDSQEIGVDYEKRFSQTFPNKVSWLYRAVHCITFLSLTSFASLQNWTKFRYC